MKKKLKDLVKDFKAGKVTRREFLKETSGTILSLPVFFGYFEEDIKHEFFAFIASKIDKIVSRYREIETASFETWFNLVLKRYFIYFTKIMNRKEENENTNMEELYKNLKNDKFSAHNEIKIDFSILSDNEKKVVFMKYGFNSDSEMRYGSILEKLDKKRQLEDKISEKYLNLLKIRKALIQNYEPQEIAELKRKEQKILKTKRNLESKFNSINLFSTNY